MAKGIRTVLGSDTYIYIICISPLAHVPEVNARRDFSVMQRSRIQIAAYVLVDAAQCLRALVRNAFRSLWKYGKCYTDL